MSVTDPAIALILAELGDLNKVDHHGSACSEPDPNLFWPARPELQCIHDYALGKRASPWAALGVALTRVVAGIPPTVVLPDLVGDHASLNMFIGLVGPSGAGKGAATAAGTRAVEIGFLHDVEVHTVGSGQGIAHAYAHREKGELVQHATKAMFVVEEVDHLDGNSRQVGSTMLAELRRVFMGERLGHLYADPSRRLPIDAHGYRATLTVGIQPTRAGVLLDDADGGTPQRFVWLPTTYPHPDVRPTAPAPWRWKAPTFRSGRHIIDVCDTAVKEIDDAALARSRGEGDPLDGHRLLTREKVAAALGLLNGRAEISDDDWELSASVMAQSDTTRAEVVATLAMVTTQRNTSRARAEGDRAVIVNERVEEAAIGRVARTIMRLIGDDWTPHAALRRRVSSSGRAHFDEAIERLLAAGQLDRKQHVDGGQYDGVRYRRNDTRP